MKDAYKKLQAAASDLAVKNLYLVSQSGQSERAFDVSARQAVEWDSD